MEILGNSPAILTAAILWIVFPVALPAALAFALRVYRPRAVLGPERLHPRQPAWPVALALAMGFTLWFGTQVVYISAKSASPGHSATMPAVAFAPAGADWAFLATAPALIGFISLWLMDFAIGGNELLARLGLGLRAFPAGVAKGLLAAIIIIPPIFVIMELTEWVDQYLHYVHPMEHDLLKAMGESHESFIRVTLILGAVLAAPLFEEFLFRGHLQTLIHRTLVVLTSPRQGNAGFPVVQPTMETPRGTEVITRILPDATAPVSVVPAPPQYAWQTWAAIFFTSCLFAMVHPMWMWPPIFALSMGLGYTYERTGNLWANITVHCAFNSISTLFYFYFHAHGG